MGWSWPPGGASFAAGFWPWPVNWREALLVPARSDISIGLAIQAALQSVVSLDMADFLGDLVPDRGGGQVTFLGQVARMFQRRDKGVGAMKAAKIIRHGAQFLSFHQFVHGRQIAHLSMVPALTHV